MLSPQGQRGLEANIFGLGLGIGIVSSGLVLVLTKVVPVASFQSCDISVLSLMVSGLGLTIFFLASASLHLALASTSALLFPGLVNIPA